jgi:hypothetical protein
MSLWEGITNAELAKAPRFPIGTAPEPLDAEGQLLPMKLAPNFQLTMFLAQATGSMVVTDSVFRWNELKQAVRPALSQTQPLLDMRRSAKAKGLPFLQDKHR